MTSTKHHDVSLEIIRRLKLLRPSTLSVEDESHLHVGHLGAGSGGHYRVIIAAKSLNAHSRVEQHRMVYSALEDLFPDRVHALAIEVEPG